MARPGSADGARGRTAADPRPGSVGHVLDLIRRTGGLTRAEILDATGLARATVNSRLATLLAADLVEEGGTTAIDRGRPPSHFRFRPDTGALLLAEAGATGVRTALTDLDGHFSQEITISLDITIGPEAWLAEVYRTFEELLDRQGCDPSFVRGVGLALPGPVDFASGTVVRPPIMVGWDRYPLREWFARRLDCPVVVDNDANVMALGEYRAEHAGRTSMLMLKIATGVGAGIITGGAVYRGEDGAAGDLGHIQISHEGPGEAPHCRCGNVGCIEAYAGGWAILRDLGQQGRQIGSVTDLVALVGTGDPQVLTVTRAAGRTIGIALADAVSLLNPSVVVVGGELGLAADNLVAGIREVVYARCLPLATRQLEIIPAALGRAAGLTGLAAILTDHLFDPALVDARLG